MKRGTIIWVNLEDATPPEFGKIRPGLVVSNTEQNFFLETVVILPVSSRPPEIWPLRVRLKLPKGKEAFAVIPGIRQVSKTRLSNVVGYASSEALNHLDEALRVYLGD